jgi:DNA end-binding protein Ku
MLSKEAPMSRPSWSGHLRVSLVTCPITLLPATSETERIHLNEINPATGNRISLKPVDAETGDPVERSDLVKGYQYEKGQYVVLDKEDLDGIQIESTRILDLTAFVDRASVNPLYSDTPYFIYPEGKTGVDAYRVIAEAMRNSEQVGIGSIVLTSREHPVVVEPFEEGLMMSLLRTAEEVREPEFELPKDKIDADMVRMAEEIMERLQGKWEPPGFHDRYQDALRELIEAKVKGLPREKRPAPPEPSNVIDLMAALKRSLTAKAPSNDRRTSKSERSRGGDRDQANMQLLASRNGRRDTEATPGRDGQRPPRPRGRKKTF